MRRKFLTCAVSVIGAGMASSSLAQQWVNPVSGGPPEGGSLWGGPGHDGVAYTFPASMPPLDQIPEMPIPDPSEGISDPNGSTAITYHNALTGETYELPQLLPSGLEGDTGLGWIPPELDIDPSDEFIRTFGNMVVATSLNSFPRSGNVKLIMRFVDSGGTDRYFVCSAAMNDAGVILTAAHCVYARSPSGFNIFDWASDVWVIPAWDGVGNILPISDVLDHFGWSRGWSYVAGSDYINNGNFDRDMGTIRLGDCERSVGMLTGWYGWAWGFSCSTIRGRTYHNFSYPAENCGGGLHTGRTMYYWNGRFDSCPGNQLQIDTSGGCLNAVWGGMSGSNAYYIDGDNRFAHAVCSNSNRTTIGRYCKMWETFKNAMEDQKSIHRGTTFDLEALMFRVGGSTTVTAGQSLPASNVRIINATNANPAASQYTLHIYLSTNNNISTSDTLLANWNYNTDFAAMQSRTFNVPAPAISVGVPSGTYWIGTVIDFSEDSNSCNNDSDTWDATQVTVLGVADIKAQSVNAPSGTFFHGQNMNVGFVVQNIGGDPSNTVTVEIRASLNTTITSSDPLLGSFNLSGLAGGASHNTSRSVQIPNNLAPGTYYIGIISTSSDDVNGSNNTAFDATPIGVDGRADLNALSVDAPAGTFIAGCDRIDPIRYTVRNDGTINSGNYTVQVRASLDTNITGADPLLGSFNHASLAPNASNANSVAVSVPGGLAPADYYIGITVTPGVNENNTSNNANHDATPVTVEVCIADFNNDCAVNSLDFLAFLNAFVAGDRSADINGDGNVNTLDFLAFLNLFVAGC